MESDQNKNRRKCFLNSNKQNERCLNSIENIPTNKQYDNSKVKKQRCEENQKIKTQINELLQKVIDQQLKNKQKYLKIKSKSCKIEHQLISIANSDHKNCQRLIYLYEQLLDENRELERKAGKYEFLVQSQLGEEEDQYLVESSLDHYAFLRNTWKSSVAIDQGHINQNSEQRLDLLNKKITSLKINALKLKKAEEEAIHQPSHFCNTSITKSQEYLKLLQKYEAISLRNEELEQVLGDCHERMQKGSLYKEVQMQKKYGDAMMLIKEWKEKMKWMEENELKLLTETMELRESKLRSQSTLRQNILRQKQNLVGNYHYSQSNLNPVSSPTYSFQILIFSNHPSAQEQFKQNRQIKNISFPLQDIINFCEENSISKPYLLSSSKNNLKIDQDLETLLKESSFSTNHLDFSLSVIQSREIQMNESILDFEGVSESVLLTNSLREIKRITSLCDRKKLKWKQREVESLIKQQESSKKVDSLEMVGVGIENDQIEKGRIIKFNRTGRRPTKKENINEEPIFENGKESEFGEKGQ